MRATCVLLALVAPAMVADPILVEKPDAFPTLVNPNCSHCVDEAKRRAGELRPDDPVLAWTRGYSDGGAVPVRFFLNPYRVISDSYGVFVYDPDAGFARGFAPGYTFRFHGWRNGVMVMKDTRDGTLYSCLSGVAFAGPKTGTRLPTVPTLTTTWGEVMARNPDAVAYHMFEKYKPTELPTAETPESVRSRGTPDPRRLAGELVLGVRVGDATKAYPLADLKKQWLLADTVGGQPVLVLCDGKSAAAYKPVATAPRKYKAPRPNDEGVSPPNPGVPLSGKEEPAKPVTLEKVPVDAGFWFIDTGTRAAWDVAGRCQSGPLKGWTLEPLDAVQCKWFAWAAEYPNTEIHGLAATRSGAAADPKKAAKMVAGTAEFLRLLPKPWATVKAVDPAARTVTLLLDGDKTPKVWPVEPDAEIKVAGWWGRLEQFRPDQRAWAWLKLDRRKQPVAVAMLCDEPTEWDMHGSLKDDAKPRFPDLEAKRKEQQSRLRQRWSADGLPGTLTFHHVFSGELELMLDHEAIRWGRSLKEGDTVHVQADPPIKGVVRTVSPWRERTRVRLVVGELASADLKLGQRLPLKMTPPPMSVDESPYPPDLDRSRTPAERAEWFLCSTYCVCPVKPDICTGMFYTLASCNPNGCGAPNALRDEVLGLIAKGKTDRQIWDELLKDRGPLMTRPHLLP